MYLPVIDPLDKAHLFSIDKTWSYIYTMGLSLEELMSNLPAVKEDTIMKKNLAKGKEKDKGRSFDRSNVQMELICDGCNTHWCVYSNKMVGAKGGPKISNVEELQQWSEGGKMCGSKVPVDKYYVQRKLFCGDYTESRYYNHLGGKKVKNNSNSGRSATGNICAICNSFQDYCRVLKQRKAVILEETNLYLYAVIASIVILKSQPQEDPVTHKKSRAKGGQEIRGNHK